MMRRWILQRQLKQAGASKAECAALRRLAGQVGAIAPGLSREAKAAIAADIGFKPVRVHRRHTFELAGAAALVVAVIVLAQFTAPSSPLYAIKRGTQNVRAYIQPSYKKELLKQRDQDQGQSKNQTPPTMTETTAQPQSNRGAQSDPDNGPQQDNNQPDDDSGASPHGADDTPQSTDGQAVPNQPTSTQADDHSTVTGTDDAKGSSPHSSPGGSGSSKHKDDQ